MTEPIYRACFCRAHYRLHIEQGGDRDRWEPHNGSSFCAVLECDRIAAYIERRLPGEQSE